MRNGKAIKKMIVLPPPGFFSALFRGCPELSNTANKELMYEYLEVNIFKLWFITCIFSKSLLLKIGLKTRIYIKVFQISYIYCMV